MNIKDEMPHLKVTATENGLIRLENEMLGDSYFVDIHPMQLRHVAQMAGLLPEVSASDADMLRTERAMTAELRRDMDRCKRTLAMLHGRCEQLYKNLCDRADEGRTDLCIELAQSAALADMTTLLCADFEAASSTGVQVTEATTEATQD
jgi:hypothetical protein